MDATADDWLSGSDDRDGSSSGFSELQDRVSDWGNRMQDRVRQGRQDGAKNVGRFAENGASKTGSAAGNNGAGNSSFMSAVQNARDAEGRGGFANNVQGKTLETAAAAAMPGGKMIMKQAKKFGPFGTILAIVAVLMGVFAGSQSLAPFGLVANGLDQFNNLRTSMNKRNNYFMRFQMDRTRNHEITKRATIFSPEKFKISNGMAKKLGKQNVYYIDSGDFDCRFLIYKDQDTGKTYAVAANDNDVSKLPSGGVDVEIDGKMQHFDISDGGRLKIDDALIDSNNFSRSVDVGTRTMKGHVAGWFDDLSAKLHKRLGSSRNKFRDTPDDATEEDIKKRAKDVDEGLSEEIAATQKNKNEDDNPQELKDKPVTDDSGNPQYNEDGTLKTSPQAEDIEIENDGLSKNASDTDIKNALGQRTKAVVGAMGAGVDVYCTVMKAYSMLNALVGGIMVANIINYITGFLEAIQRTQAGDAGKSELSYYMTGLSQKGATTDMNGEVIEGKEHTSSLESPAWNQFFSSGGLIVSSADKAAQKFNRDTAMDMGISAAPGIVGEIVGSGYAATSSFKNGIEAYKNCLTAQAALAGASLIISVVVAFCSFGIGAFIKDWAQGLLKDAAVAVIQGFIMAGFMALIPYIAKWLAVDLISNMAGEDAAYAINSGMNIYLGRQMQASSGLPATEDKLMAHWREQQEVIAEEGALERSMRSPFDPTSKYTFLGSIVNTLMPIANTYSAPLTTVSKTMNAVGVAASSLLPTAKADGEVRFETSLNYDCPTLSDLGLVGDAYCNPYFVTDYSTINKDPAEVFAIVAGDDKEVSKDLETGVVNTGDNDNFIWENVDDEEHNGNPDINPKSKLGKWVISCAVRDSQFGQVDSNVMNAIGGLINTGSGAIDTALEVGLGLIPFVDDAVDIASAAKEGANVDWASGGNCIKEEYKYYSRYSEDQRMMESAGIIKQSAVAKLVEQYYEENPVDNSREGIIARYSGYTKEEVAEALDAFEYMEWLAEYDPTTYGPEKYEEKDGSYQYESNEIIAKTEEAVVGNYIVFDDLRTKTKIA